MIFFKGGYMARYTIESDGHLIEINKTILSRTELVKYDGKTEVKSFSDSSYADYFFDKEEGGRQVRYRVLIRDLIWPISWQIKVQKDGRLIFSNR